MRRFFVLLALMALACSVPVRVPTVPPTFTPAPSPTAEATGTASEQVVIVRQPVVTVRETAGGTPTGDYILAGQEVAVLQIRGDWVQIDEPRGWVFIGCLEGLSKKRCEAK